MQKFGNLRWSVLSRMSRLSASIGGAFALAIGLGACVSGLVVSVEGDYRRYTPTYVSYAAASGPIWAFIDGQAFAGTPDAFASAVLSQIQGRPTWIGGIYYDAVSAPGGTPAYYVALSFNPPVSYDGDDACAQKRASGTPRPGGDLRVVAAFCSSVFTLSSVVVTADGVTSADSAGFRALMERVMNDLFPSSDAHVGASIQQNN
jgi:hypothetical protein